MSSLGAGGSPVRRQPDSFTLVEVALALAVATIVIVALFPLVVNALQQSSNTRARDEAVSMLPSLTVYLQDEQTFSASYATFQSLSSGSSPLYLLVRNSAGNTSVSPPGDTNRAALVAQQDGPLIGVELSLSSNNPVASLPATQSSYPCTVIVLDARAYAVSNPTAANPGKVGPPLYCAPIVISE